MLKNIAGAICVGDVEAPRAKVRPGGGGAEQ